MPFDPRRTNAGFSHVLHLADGLAGAVIDVGANGGAEARIASRAGRTVYSFECLTSAYAELLHDPAYRALPNVTLFHACAGKDQRMAVLHLAQDSSSLTAANVAHGYELKKARREPTHTEPVLVQPLDPYFLRSPPPAPPQLAMQPIALIKVDVQGTEASVLEGLRGVIERDRPVVMYEEMRVQPRYNYAWFRSDGDPRQWLEPLGYACNKTGGAGVDMFCTVQHQVRL